MNSINGIKYSFMVLVWGMITLPGEIAESKSKGERHPVNFGNAQIEFAKQESTSRKGKIPPGVTLNACGCYRWNESCVCTDRNGKCECPGDCEPVGCEAKRRKQIEKEIADEEKRIRDEAKKREEAETARLKAEQAQREKAAEELEAQAAADDSMFPNSQDAGVVEESQKPSKKARKPSLKKENQIQKGD